MRPLLVTAALLPLLGVSALATTGNQIEEFCRTDKKFAAAYVLGLAEQAEDASSTLFAASTFWASQPAVRDALDRARTQIMSACVPSQVTGRQQTDVVCAYIASKPTERHLPMVTLYQRAVSAAWPCKE